MNNKEWYSMYNEEWIDFLSNEWQVSRASARKMLEALMAIKNKDNAKKAFDKFNKRKSEEQRW